MDGHNLTPYLVIGMLIPLIISGGSGSRLWPHSREAHPKPYVELPDGSTLIGRTFQRAANLSGVREICTVANQNHYFLAVDCYADTDVEDIEKTYLLEKAGRNTAPAIAVATLTMAQRHGDDAVLLVLPADHMISDVDAFQGAVERASTAARGGQIVTFGIKATSPETGYGYIEVDGEEFVAFVEKPDKKTAGKFVKSGRHFWNSGMFCFTAGTMIEAMNTHCPEVLSAARNCLAASDSVPKQGAFTVRLDGDSFQQAPDISIDYAVMEKAQNIACVTTDCGWSDIGSWDAYAAFFGKDDHNNRITGEIVAVDSKNCVVDAKTRLVALVGMKDVIVVDTDDAILVADRNATQDVRKVFSALKDTGHEAAIAHRTVHRPWGTYTVLEEGGRFKIKRIMVKPGQRLSLQAHHHRSEHWVVVSGTAKVVNGEDEILLATNQSTYIPCGAKHRLENPGIVPLNIIEVQTGEYLGEDDIVRFEDIYGRA